MQYDAIIIGGGPGGTAAARILAAGGKKVAVIEEQHWGGTCLNCGCIPTKLLLGAIAPKSQLHALARQRLAGGEIVVDFAALRSRVSRFLKGSRQVLAKSLTEAGIDLRNGRGVCAGQGLVSFQADGKEELLQADAVILAGGSRNAVFSGMAPDGEAVLDSTGALALADVPESLIIVGAGAIGLELGDFYAALGARVTMVEAAPHIAPSEDPDIAAELERAITKAGRTCISGVKAVSLATRDGQARLELEDGRVLTAQKALVAIGRAPNTKDLDCEKAGCARDRRGFVVVDAALQAAATVHAVGDINGRTLLAHAAEHQGAYVARRLLGEETGPYVPGPVPACIYGGVEVMRVGETAKALAAAGRPVAVSAVPLSLNAIAQAGGNASGLVKVVWDGEDMAGIAAVGHGVSHLVTVAQLLLAGRYTPERLHEVMFAHPTLDEIVPMAIRAPRKPVAAQ